MNTEYKVKQRQRLALPLYSLGCSSGDARTVERILAKQPGVIDVYANPATETAYVEYDPALTDENRLAAVIRQFGYGLTKGK